MFAFFILFHVSFFNLIVIFILYLFAVTPNEMVVTWVTLKNVSDPFVFYGLNDLQLNARAITNKFTDGGPEKRSIYVHRAIMSNLSSGKKYSKYTY